MPLPLSHFNSPIDPGEGGLRVAGVGAYRHAKSKTEAIAWIVEEVACDAASGPDLIGRHHPECGRAEKMLAIEFAAVEQQLREACVIRDCRDKPASPKFPLPVGLAAGRSASTSTTSRGKGSAILCSLGVGIQYELRAG